MSARIKLAIILSRFPFPLDKGDKLRAFHQIKFLSAYFDIALFALSSVEVQPKDFQVVSNYCKEIHIYPLNKFTSLWQSLLSLFKGWPVQVGYFYSATIREKMQETIHHWQPDIVYCQLARTALYGKSLPYKKVVDFQDAFSLNYHRIQHQSSGWLKWFYARESRCMKQFEKQMYTWFDEATIISSFDKDQIEVSPNSLVVVPNGVDLAYFIKDQQVKKTDILFSGNLSYLPNKNAVLYLLEKIAPLLIQQMPGIRIQIVGASAEDFIGYASDNISIKGWYDDIRDAYNETKLFVAPLFTGAGLQNKLLEAMSMELPCITTSVVNASLGAERDLHLLIADDAQTFVEHIVHLLGDESLQKKLQKNGRAFVEQNYSWQQANEKLISLFNK